MRVEYDLQDNNAVLITHLLHTLLTLITQMTLYYILKIAVECALFCDCHFNAAQKYLDRYIDLFQRKMYNLHGYLKLRQTSVRQYVCINKAMPINIICKGYHTKKV